MKIKCPACSEPVSATDINVQQMIAVCPHCDNVFKLEGIFLPQQRKLKAPVQFSTLSDDPTQLHMTFKWSWRTEPPLSMTAIIFLFIVTLLMMVAMVAEGAPLLMMLLPLIPFAFASYTLLTLLANRTHYESDGEILKVYTEPLPYMRYGKQSIAIAEIREISVERPAYAPFPEGKAGFYHVYVHTFDSDKIRIAAYVNYEHAHFIAQELRTHLQALKEIPTHLISQDGDEFDLDALETNQSKGLHSQR